MTRERHHVALPAFQPGALLQIDGHHLVKDIDRNGDLSAVSAAVAVDVDAPGAVLDHEALKALDCTSRHVINSPIHQRQIDANLTRFNYPVRVIPASDVGDSSITSPRAIASQRIESTSKCRGRGSAGVRWRSSVYLLCSHGEHAPELGQAQGSDRRGFLSHLVPNSQFRFAGYASRGPSPRTLPRLADYYSSSEKTSCPQREGRYVPEQQRDTMGVTGWRDSQPLSRFGATQGGAHV